MAGDGVVFRDREQFRFGMFANRTYLARTASVEAAAGGRIFCTGNRPFKSDQTLRFIRIGTGNR